MTSSVDHDFVETAVNHRSESGNMWIMAQKGMEVRKASLCNVLHLTASSEVIS